MSKYWSRTMGGWVYDVEYYTGYEVDLEEVEEKRKWYCELLEKHTITTMCNI